MLTSDQLQIMQDTTTSLFTKITDGDEAILKLKSLELGNSVKGRLVDMMELHAASRGGLDGLIASSIAKLNDSAALADCNLKDAVTSLQKSAEQTSKSANEMLLSLLSKKSVLRDQIMLKVEESLMMINDRLQSIFGESLTMSTILSVVTSQQSTQALFEPIASKIREEILFQLTTAEKDLDDPTALFIMERVRSIVESSSTGDISSGNPLDSIKTMLDDESTVNLGQSMIMKGERVLDVIEDASKSKHFENIMSSVRQAGLTEDAVINSLQQIDVDDIISNVDDLVNDDAARRNMVAGATDSALEFLLKFLPSVEIPKLEGVKDGTMYSIADISLDGFKLQKEDIDVQIAGISANAYAEKKRASASSTGDSLRSSSESPSSISPSSSPSGESTPQPPQSPAELPDVKSNELLVIRVDNIQAQLEGIKWSFEQTYFPHMNGEGMADASVGNAHLLLKFELRKKKKKKADNTDSTILPTSTSSSSLSSSFAPLSSATHEPVLCLNERSCTIESMNLNLKGDSMSWLYNMLASLFKNLLKEYVVKTVMEALSNSSGYLLETLNSTLSVHWPLLLKMSKLSVDDLEEVDETAITDTTKIMGKDIVELVWREPVPLGMKLLMNDGSGEVKVVEFPRGGQAIRVAEAADFDPKMFRGATICGVNGRKFVEPPSAFSNRAAGSRGSSVGLNDGGVNNSKIQQVLAALKEPGRPKSIEFLISESERTRIMRLLGKNDDGDGGSVGNSTLTRNASKTVSEVSISRGGPIGLQFGTVEDELGLKVLGFKEGAENDQIKIGSILVSINGSYVHGSDDNAKKAMDAFKAVGDKRPITLGFVEPATITKKFSGDLPCTTTLKGSSTSMKMYGSPSEELILAEARDKETDR